MALLLYLVIDVSDCVGAFAAVSVGCRTHLSQNGRRSAISGRLLDISEPKRKAFRHQRSVAGRTWTKTAA